MFINFGIFVLHLVMITRDCQGAPSIPLPGDFRQILRSFVPTPIGRSLNLNDVKIAYYGNNVKNNTFYRTKDTESLLKDRSFVLEKPTVLYIHGYEELVTDDSVNTVASAYIKHGGYNVLVLDWSNLAFGNYLIVLFNIQPVGDEAGKALVKLLKAGLQLQGLHIVGHSLGAQIGSVVARYLASEGYSVKRLTGLDPAFPGFYPPILTKPISPKDALFVDIIHTASGQFGSPVSGGQVDFWPNGGKPVQPGCPKIFIPLSDRDICSHWRSWQFWAESVLGGNFLATKCPDYDAFLKGHCTGLGRMGLQATPDLYGDYYLRTAAEEPFALGERGV